MNRLREAFKKMICLRETKECRKGQHWLGLQKLLTLCFEPIKGLCTTQWAIPGNKATFFK